MKKEIADKFIAALRSDQYKQGRDRLITILDDGTETHCCLSVLCQLAIQDGVAIVQEGEGYRWDSADGYENMTLPMPVRQWAGTSSVNCEYWEGEDERQALDTDNDDRKLNFHQIADVVEQHWGQM